MEETRSFGYICPKCGRAVMARRSAFSPAAAAAHIECPCGQSDMLIETDGSRLPACGCPAACAAKRTRPSAAFSTPYPAKLCRARASRPGNLLLCGPGGPGVRPDGATGRPGRQGEGGGGPGLHRPTLLCMRCCRAEGHCRPGRHPRRCGGFRYGHPGPPGLRGPVFAKGLRQQSASARRHRRGSGPPVFAKMTLTIPGGVT